MTVICLNPDVADLHANGWRRVLVVEDDEPSRRMFEEILSDAELRYLCVDHTTLPAADGFTTVVTNLPQRFEHYSSECAIEWTNRLRERYGAPVIVVTGRPEALNDDVLKTIAYVLGKPIDVESFVTTVLQTDRRKTRRVS